MKNWRKVTAALLVLAMVFSMAACGNGGTTSSTPASTPESTPASAPESSAAESTPASEPVSEPTDTGTEDTPRNETLYYGGEQWNKPTNMNPLSTTSNFGVMEQDDQATVIVYETLYMFNTLDGKAYPLLADGDYTWNADRTVCTVKTKAAAKWDDGTPFTAKDVQATWDAHVKYESAFAADYTQYIESVIAKDDSTVEFTTKPVDDEKYNPLKVEEYLCKMYQMQGAYLEKLDGELGGDSGEIKNAGMWDAPLTGAYRPTMYDSEQKWICTRNDEYWGQDESMWGKLPVPKYIAHNIYKDNDASARAFRNGEIDINQQYISNLQDYWEKDGLPVATYNDEAPYQDSIGMPSAVLNTKKPGLDQKEVRLAIAMAVDYDQIIASAMTGQSYTFEQVPRSLFNASAGEQALIKDPETLKPYQFTGADVEGAKKILDDAGIVDTNGDGNREYNGTELSYKCECPTGWNDWEAAMTIVSAAGKEIGISMETYFPEAAQYNEDVQTGNFDITMTSYSAAGISNPWTRMYSAMYGFGGNFPETVTFNYGRYYNEEVDKILMAMPKETDEAKLLDYYEQLNIIYLTEVPSFALMYRPVNFHETNETVWTGFPEKDDGSNIPPMILYDGYGYAGMFNLELVG